VGINVKRRVCAVLIASAGLSDAAANELDLYSLHTASFVWHAYAPTKDYTQYFKNELVALEKQIDEKSDYSLYGGTLINSEGNRCALLGMEKRWGEYHNLVIEGIYVYAGEFFIKPFSQCGDAGAYREMKKLSGIGFAPYIYHGVKYEINRYVSFRSGFILPGIVVLSLQLGF